jgi:hypothetical protein
MGIVPCLAVAEDTRAPGGNTLFPVGGSVGRQIHRCRNTQTPGSVCQRQSVIAARSGDHAALPLFLIELQQVVKHPTRLKRSRDLEVFQFDSQIRMEIAAQRGQRHERRASDERCDAFTGGFDVLKRKRVHHRLRTESTRCNVEDIAQHCCGGWRRIGFKRRGGLSASNVGRVDNPHFVGAHTRQRMGKGQRRRLDTEMEIIPHAVPPGRAERSARRVRAPLAGRRSSIQ